MFRIMSGDDVYAEMPTVDGLAICEEELRMIGDESTILHIHPDDLNNEKSIKANMVAAGEDKGQVALLALKLLGGVIKELSESSIPTPKIDAMAPLFSNLLDDNNVTVVDVVDPKEVIDNAVKSSVDQLK